ncbi:unnamed protein product [Cuscuta campestris]|uniref:Uncharacterized protein n=1 Tax=Cuscuta campestris TaxID=132261 RepID=A0A484KZF4_9ASTE|nr:unnamed protein product [Cuscuta campestris]
MFVGNFRIEVLLLMSLDLETMIYGLRYGLGGLDQDMGCRMDGVNQEKTGVKRKQPDQRNGGRDLDEAEGCRMGGANQTNTSVKRKQPDLRYGCNGSDEDEVLPCDYAFGSMPTDVAILSHPTSIPF